MAKRRKENFRILSIHFYNLNRQLHIVCLDVPWPADYGGAIDMMNRIIILKKLGIGIHLHYFSYNERGNPGELKQYCESIHVYKRKTGLKGISFTTPYIISSRRNDELVNDLQKDDHPVLLEGLHSTAVLNDLDLQNRKVVVRMHNEESLYYKEMARSETNFFKKIYFRNESRLLKKYSRHLPGTCLFACISKEDARTLNEEYHLSNAAFLPAFLSWQNVSGMEGVGNFCLYHGNLSVPENEKAACWLLRNVFTKIQMPLVIAGKKPSQRLAKQTHFYQHACMVENPSESEMNDLVRKAHINILPCFNKYNTGIRLKLLHALFEGRHCIVTDAMVKGTGLESACHIGANANDMASIITQLYHQPFTSEEITLRKKLLGETYDNEKNAKQLIQYLW